MQKHTQVTVWAVIMSGICLGLLPMGLGCGKSGGGGEAAKIIFAYPNPALIGGTNLDGATAVPLGIVITGTSTASDKLPITRDTFSMTVNDGTSDISGIIEFPDSTGQSSVLFIPDKFLDPGKRYTIKAGVSSPAYSTVVSFDTAAGVGTNPAAVSGQGYALHLPSGSVTQPPGIGSIVEQYLADINIVLTTTDLQQVAASPDSGFIQFTGGEGNPTQTGLSPGSFVLPLSGPYLGPYTHVGGSLSINISGYILVIDNFNIYGTLANMTGGVGITDGTLAAIATCANLPAEIKSVVQNFCTDTGYLILVGSFYATPFIVTPATDINGFMLGAAITNPTNGATSVPRDHQADVWADITRPNDPPITRPCIAITSTSISVTLRDWTTGELVSGTVLTTTTAVPGCTTGVNGPITALQFSPSASLASGRQYKALTILDLSPVASTTFTTQ